MTRYLTPLPRLAPGEWLLATRGPNRTWACIGATDAHVYLMSSAMGADKFQRMSWHEVWARWENGEWRKLSSWT